MRQPNNRELTFAYKVAELNIKTFVTFCGLAVKYSVLPAWCRVRKDGSALITIYQA